MSAAVAAGAAILTMPRFDLGQFLSLIEAYRVTLAFVAPPIVLALARHPVVERFDLSSLRRVVSGVAPPDAGLARAASKRIGCLVV